MACPSTMPLVEETSAAIKQTEARTSDLDSIVDQFKIRDDGASSDPAEAPPATRQDQVKSLKNKPRLNFARACVSCGNRALKDDWTEF